MTLPYIIIMFLFLKKDKLKNSLIEDRAKNHIGEIVVIKNNAILRSACSTRYRYTRENIAVVCDVDFSYDIDNCICGVTYKVLTSNGTYWLEYHYVEQFIVSPVHS